MILNNKIIYIAKSLDTEDDCIIGWTFLYLNVTIATFAVFTSKAELCWFSSLLLFNSSPVFLFWILTPSLASLFKGSLNLFKTLVVYCRGKNRDLIPKTTTLVSKTRNIYFGRCFWSLFYKIETKNIDQKLKNSN